MTIMRDTTIETYDLHVSVLHVGTSRLCVSHIVGGVGKQVHKTESEAKGEGMRGARR
jgi:hypothetical protein